MQTQIVTKLSVSITLWTLFIFAAFAQTPQQQQITGDCNIALQNIQRSKVSVIQTCIGEEALVRLVELIAQKRPDLLTTDDQEKLELLRTSFGLTKGALKQFFSILGEENIAPDNLAQKLVDIAELHKTLLKQARLLSGDDPEVRALRDQAILAIEQGRLYEAEHYLAKAEAADLAAAARLVEASEKRKVNAAATRAERGRTALLRLRYREAAGHFRQAANMLPAGQAEERRGYLEAEADAFYRHGHQKGENDALREAIRLYRELSMAVSGEDPLNLATIQNNLGIALQTLGERESGTERLEEAVAAYRAALEEWTRSREPLDWARVHNNLGNALLRIGERQRDMVTLKDAADAYKSALEEWRQDRVPLLWALSQNNLGNVLWTRGEREIGTATLLEAIAAYRAALQEWKRERTPLEWALTQNNLGTALASLGKREREKDRLIEAADACRNALEEWTRERVPLEWARAKNNLGVALWTLGERGAGTTQLRNAVDAYHDALKQWTRERVPLDWARAQSNLGAALTTIGQRERNVVHLNEAIEVLNTALEEGNRDRVPLDWGETQHNLGEALMAIAELGRDVTSIEKAIAAFNEALKERTRKDTPVYWAITQTSLCKSLTIYHEIKPDERRLSSAAAICNQALAVFEDGNVTYFIDRAKENLAYVERLKSIKTSDTNE